MSDSIKLFGRNTVEQNREALKRATWQSDDEKNLIESMQAKFGIDIRDPKAFPVLEAGYSWKKTRQKLAEADSLSAFPQVLRAGVQSSVNAMYETVPTTFEEWAHVINSSRIEELYAPIQGLGFLANIGENELYPETGAAGLDIKLRNRKYGVLFPISKELLEDDQTGQFQKLSGLMGQYAKQVLEVLCYGKLASVAGMKYSTIEVPQSETQPSTESSYPWSTSLVGGGANRPASYGALTQSNIQNGFIGLMNQKNILGLKMAVQPDRIIISPKYNFDLGVLLHSAYYPSGAASSGQVGGAFAINPIQGIADKTVSRFMFNYDGTVDGSTSAWYLVDSKAPWFVCQVREAAAVEVENPTSGKSFDSDTIRFKVRLRANADHIDSRFAWQGNNGSV
jgi:phage major head subunit gpT-like protein